MTLEQIDKGRRIQSDIELLDRKIRALQNSKYIGLDLTNNDPMARRSGLTSIHVDSEFFDNEIELVRERVLNYFISQKAQLENQLEMI